MNDALMNTTIHELGHAFGLEHEPGTLMAAACYEGSVVDSDTLGRFCDIYSCW